MSIRYRCETCGAAFKIRDSQAGTRARCPGCKIKFTVPLESTLTVEEYEVAEREQKNAIGSSPNLQEQKSDIVAESPSAPSLPPPVNHKSSTRLSSPAGKEPLSSPSLKKTPAPPRPEETVPEPAEAKPVEAVPEPELEAEPEAEPEFDAEAFLLDSNNDAAKKSAGLTTQQAPTDNRPPTDALGRRYFGAGPKAAKEDVPADAMGASVVTTAQLPPGKERKKIDWKETRKQLVRRSPYIGAGLAVILAAYFISARYLSARLPFPLMAEVTGRVEVDGKPLSGVIVHFTPLDATQARSASNEVIRLTDAVGLTDVDGRFQLSYLDRSGAPLGKGRIWLEPLTPADYSRIPVAYQTAGGDIRNVREAGNEGKFDLKLK